MNEGVVAVKCLNTTKQENVARADFVQYVKKLIEENPVLIAKQSKGGKDEESKKE